MRFPKAKVIAGVWGFTDDTERAMQRFQPSRPHKLVTSLSEAVKFVVDAEAPRKDQPENTAVPERLPV
jgi:hypothetical protein